MLEKLENGPGTTDYYLTSRLGVVRKIPKQLRYLPRQYCGMELLNLPMMETTAAQVNCLLQHYGTDSELGHTMTAAMEHLQLEIGVEGCPLSYNFQKYGCLATNIWAKSLWEKVQAYKIEISLDYKGLHQPRGQQDRCLMEILVEDHKVEDDTLQRVNRVQKHQEVATMGGKKVDSYYAEDWTLGHEGSTGKQ